MEIIHAADRPTRRRRPTGLRWWWESIWMDFQGRSSDRGSAVKSCWEQRKPWLQRHVNWKRDYLTMKQCTCCVAPHLRRRLRWLSLAVEVATWDIRRFARRTPRCFARTGDALAGGSRHEGRFKPAPPRGACPGGIPYRSTRHPQMVERSTAGNVGR